ncbi:MAG: hypothetical protein M3P30_04550 [Chloroflexota bacterium]|nr:hypothetical protein [Chloroflexota bacterium]
MGALLLALAFLAHLRRRFDSFTRHIAFRFGNGVSEVEAYGEPVRPSREEIRLLTINRLVEHEHGVPEIEYLPEPSPERGPRKQEV